MRFLLLFFISIFSTSLFAEKVIVSIEPTKYLVERIGGNEVECLLFVPPGTSPHSYEPSLKQIIDSEQAKIWFRIGEGFETRVLKVFKDMKVVDLRENLPLLPSRCHCHKDAIDTHIWMTPHLLICQAEQIGSALSMLMPEKRAVFENNLALLLVELRDLDREIKEICALKKSSYFLVSHPAFGYFCKEFGFIELSIEIEGKEPSAKQVIALLATAQQQGINKVIIQPQYSKKGALYLAKELNADVITIDAYEGNVIKNLKFIATKLSQ